MTTSNFEQSDDEHTLVSLNGFGIDLVSMRDEAKFARDSMSSDKGRGVYVYINIENIDAAYEKLLVQGFTPATKPKNWSWGNREFIVKDPDGYKLCLGKDQVASISYGAY